MARGILDQPNHTAAGGLYPLGRLKDNPGDNTGTEVKEQLLGDWASFFSRLMELSGISFSGNPDNASAGYQLVDALQGAIFGTLVTVSAYLSGWQANSSDPIKYRKTGSKLVTVRGKTSSTAPAGYTSDEDIFTLPVGYRPQKDRKFIIHTIASEFFTTVQVATTGVVTILGTEYAFDSEETEINISFEID